MIIRELLLASAAAITLSATAFAAGKPDDSAARLDALQRSVADLNRQVEELKNGQAVTDSSAVLADLKRSSSAQYYDLNQQIAAANTGKPKLGIDNGRLSVTSADGRFSFAVRSLVQFDYGYFAQGSNPAAVDLNSGSNFRRAQFGLTGTAWRDWSYNFTYDFGGNGVEKSGYIYYAYLQYDGLAPFHVRAGAMTPFAGIEDATGSGDLMFLERASAQDVTRNIAGAPSREGVDLFAQGDTYLLSVSYTGKKTTDGAAFDAQQGIVGRASWLAVNEENVKWLLDADGTYVFKLPDAAANSAAANFFSFSNGPELAVDATKTVNTGNIDAAKVGEFGFESAAEYGPLYGQGGWFHYDIVRRAALPNPDFSAWYAQLSWSLTGEAHAYDPSTASFRALKPAHALGEGGLGAFEIAARFSNLNLDFQPLKSVATGGVPGGNQNVWTLGLNWYPTSGLRFMLDYYNIRASHVNAPANNLSADAIGLRSQISF